MSDVSDPTIHGKTTPSLTPPADVSLFFSLSFLRAFFCPTRFSLLPMRTIITLYANPAFIGSALIAILCHTDLF